MRTLVLAYLCLITFGDASGQVLTVSHVSDAPFSADEVVFENPRPNVRNVLPMKTIAVYRDSAGRTRVDVSQPYDPTGNPNLVIDDPVANVVYMIDERNQFARRLTFRSPPGVVSAFENPKPALGTVMMVLPGSQNVQTTSELLGIRLIQGIATEGKRVTSISPQPIPGCDQNISTVESWYSAELRMTLLEIRSNCFGEGSTHLENIRRAEPDPRLFRIPLDYLVVEQEWNKPAAKPPSDPK